MPWTFRRFGLSSWLGWAGIGGETGDHRIGHMVVDVLACMRVCMHARMLVCICTYMYVGVLVCVCRYVGVHRFLLVHGCMH